MSDPQDSRDEGPDVVIDLPSPDGARVQDRPPYRFMVISDLAGTSSGSLSGPLQGSVVDVSPSNFDEVMREACPAVHWTLTDPVQPGNVMVSLDLKFDSLKSFDPIRLIGRIPPAASLWRLREQMVARMRGQLTCEQLRDAVTRAAGAEPGLTWIGELLASRPASVPQNEEAVDDLLGQFALGEDDEADRSAGKSPAGRLISRAVAGSLSSEEASSIRRTVAELDRRLCKWLDTILHAPEVQRLESAWRSIAFMVSSFDFRQGARISLLHAPSGELVDRLTSLLIDPVFDEGMDAPDVIVVDRDFVSTESDIEILDALAEHAASLPAVILAGAAPGFFGVKNAWQVPTLPPIVSLLDQWQFAKWKSLRRKPCSGYLGLVFGRCLLRGSHDPGEVADLGFAYREECVSEKHLVWASGAVAVAGTISRSATGTGWPTHLAGQLHGRLEGFLTAVGGAKGDKTYGPADTKMAQARTDEFAAAGINVVTTAPEPHEVVVCNGISALPPSRITPEGLLEVSLPYQLFASRFARLLLELKPRLQALADRAVEETVARNARHWLGLPEEQGGEEEQAGSIVVQVGEPEDAPGGRMLAVTVTPPPHVLPGGIPMVLGYRIDS